MKIKGKVSKYMKKIAIIGAGISGLSSAHFLKDRYDVTVFEKDLCPGGLIKCLRINGNLFHTCGGHVFNSKRQDVLDWFWSIFQCETEFIKADRNSCVFIDRTDSSLEYDIFPYPIENNMYLFDERIQKDFYEDLREIDEKCGSKRNFYEYNNFDDFLLRRFGKTLYNLYFKPYNEKIWKRDLSSIPMSWMEGKLPMPTTQEMRENNMNKIAEKSFVHSFFWYEKYNGSQYIANKLADGLNIKYGSIISSITKKGNKWIIFGEEFDKVVYCGNVKDMINVIHGVNLASFVNDVESLDYHGTTAVFCEIDANPYSWIYQPSRRHKSHRIICTGNFSPTNNDDTMASKGRISATIEFTDSLEIKDIINELGKIPLNPRYLSHHYNQYSYPIQNSNTQKLIKTLKKALEVHNFYFTGRFADWEYYNMDVAIGAAMDLCHTI